LGAQHYRCLSSHVVPFPQNGPAQSAEKGRQRTGVGCGMRAIRLRSLYDDKPSFSFRNVITAHSHSSPSLLTNLRPASFYVQKCIQ